MSLVPVIAPPSQSPALRGEAVFAQPIGNREAPPATRAETARAAQPPESSAKPLRIRLEDRDGRPAGPPPAFKVSMLEVLREASLDPNYEERGPSGVASPPAARPALPPSLIDMKF